MTKLCRICGKSEFELVIDLGWQYLTGIFPRFGDTENFPGGPLRLIRCSADAGCGLVQLEQSGDPTMMYGDNYGYRSGLNRSMVNHLEHRIRSIQDSIRLNAGDLVIDIGSNDGTSLGFYPTSLKRIGIDPTAKKFLKHYPEGVVAVSDFFSAQTALAACAGRKVRVVTAFSMLYDLEEPISFVKEVASILSYDGIFVFEQSYLPLMLDRVAFDTICHEHVEYYSLRQIDWILEAAGLEAVSVELNDVNGGSFAVTAAHKGIRQVDDSVRQLRLQEKSLWENPVPVFRRFSDASRAAALELRTFLVEQAAKGKKVAGLGASTKGNVLLQFAGVNRDLLDVIGDVNPDKFGCVTPGTWIPIVSESEALSSRYDYFVVLPWHFRTYFVGSEIFEGRALVFPLPKLDVVH